MLQVTFVLMDIYFPQDRLPCLITSYWLNDSNSFVASYAIDHNVRCWTLRPHLIFLVTGEVFIVLDDSCHTIIYLRSLAGRHPIRRSRPRNICCMSLGRIMIEEKMNVDSKFQVSVLLALTLKWGCKFLFPHSNIIIRFWLSHPNLHRRVVT